VSQDAHRGQRAPRRGRVRRLEGQLSPDDRFHLRGSVEPVVGADGTLFLVRAGDADLRIRDPEPADWELVELLAGGTVSVAELTAALALDEAAVGEKLAALLGAGVVVPAAASPPLDPEDAARYARQLPWLAELGDERDLQRRLACARVTVIGCGGLGTWTLAALLCAGVRRLRVVDDDVVEASNLNRQVLYSPADVGARKVDAAARWLRAFDARAQVEALPARVGGVRDAAAAVAGADAVVLAADSPPYELARWVNATGVPFITAGQLPPLLRVGPLYRAPGAACFTCHERALRRDSTAYDAYVERVRAAPSRGATLGPASGAAGALVAWEVVQLLAGAEPASAGAALLLDLRTLAVRREPVARDGACPDCQHLRS
jgi:bacteriocin biosynthesis cyclodehydratase domain-containing protein